MIKAVLDTNVIVSAVLTADSPASRILDLMFAKQFRNYVSEPILTEYGDVLGRPRLGFSKSRVTEMLAMLKRRSIIVRPQKVVLAESDPDDNKFLECALAARADYVATGNTRHFPRRFQDIRVISPREFLTILTSELH